ncbi:MAG: hypothetical protein ACFFAS_03880 [Promethearchaeota archaeon]
MGDISKYRKNVIKMEGIVEGFCHIFIGLLVIIIAIVGDFVNIIAIKVYWMCSIMLLILAIISFFTGFKVNFIAFKRCPIIFTTSALLIIHTILL